VVFLRFPVLETSLKSQKRPPIYKELELNLFKMFIISDQYFSMCILYHPIPSHTTSLCN